MISLRNIRVYTIVRESLTVSWDFIPTSESLSDYTVQVIRSESDAGPFITVSNKLNAAEHTLFEDTSVNLHSKFRDYHYRVRVENTSSSETQDYGSVNPDIVLRDGVSPGAAVLDALPDLEALEAIRRFDLTLREYIGRKILVLNTRTTGTRCTNCWDALKRRRTKSDCMTCYGTGVVGGYYSPKLTYGCKPPESLRNQITAIFEMQPNDIVMWLSARPRVKPNDLIIALDRRFKVIAIQRSEKLWALTRQTIQVREVTKDQIEYKITITGWSEDNYTASPERLFINATDINSYNKYKREH